MTVEIESIVRGIKVEFECLVVMFMFCQSGRNLNFWSDLVWRQPLRRQCRWGGAGRLALRSVSLSRQRFGYLCLSYYCHIKIRTLHFVSNFQFSLYLMLARVRRLASVTSFCARVSVARIFFCCRERIWALVFLWVIDCEGLVKWNSWSFSTTLWRTTTMDHRITTAILRRCLTFLRLIRRRYGKSFAHYYYRNIIKCCK